MQTCRSCGERSPDRARFCMMCATPLGSSASLGETRKVVTILFADVKGSTAIGERLDPEAVRRVLSTFYVSARETLERHGGTVEKFIGDAVMAVFGVPRVREDDAQRGVRAAAALLDVMAKMNAELSDRYGAELQLRIGVNTGEVVAGDPSTGSSFVAGDAVNVAARLEQTATPGTVYLGTETYELSRAIVEVEPVEPLTLKGKRDPVPAFRLVRIREQAATDALTDVPIVGREQEIEMLDVALDRASETHALERITISGPAGIGKTRLLEECVRRSLGRARAVRCRCTPEGERAALAPVVDLLAAALGFGEVTVEDLEHAAVGLLGDDRSDLVASSLRGLVDAQDTADAAWLVAEILTRTGADGPVIVAIDDAHLGAPATHELFADVRSRALDVPLLWVEAYRTDDAEAATVPTPRPGDLTLEPLSRDDARRLLAAAVPAMRRDVTTRIVDAAEGNPLFLVETARLVGDHDEVEARIPSSIRALHATRLDELADDQRSVLEVAAVLGRTSSVHRLEELAGQAVADRLDALARSGFVGRTADVVSFSHGSVREVVYASTTKQRRAELHERAGDLGERNQDPIEVVSFHLERAASLRAELGAPDEHDRQLSGRAAAALAEAGRLTLGHGDRATTVATLERAVDLVEMAGDDGNARVAVGTLAFELGAWEYAVETLSPVDASPSVWNPLGVALVKRRADGDVEKGRALLERAAEGGDVDAAAALAGTWKGEDDERAYQLYVAALEHDAADPYALGNVLEYEIARAGDLSPVADRRPALASALLRRRGQALAGRDHPWSFFDLGKFELFLGEDEECIGSFAAAVATSSARFMLETTVRSLERVGAACGPMPGYRWALDLLDLGARARFEEAQMARADDPRWVLVGGSSAEGGGRIAAYREALIGGLDGATGTLVSGGTAQGVSALAADVSGAVAGIRSVGYLPSGIPEDVTADERYDELRRTDGEGFSPLEPLSYWRDLLAEGVPARDVAVVAIAGGRLTALEIRIALAFGARVGVIAGSGGAAAEVVRDRTWGTSAALVEVEPTAVALRTFLLPDAA